MADKVKEFARLEDAKEFADSIASAQGYPLAGRNTGKGRHVTNAPTTHWRNVIEVKGKPYVIVDEKVEAFDGKVLEVKESNKPSKQVRIDIGATKPARDVLTADVLVSEDLDELKEK